MSDSLGNFLLEMREEHKDEMKKELKTKYTGDWGELFALKYLKKLFKRNNIKNVDIEPHNDYHEDFDLEIYINGRSYKIEVKFSTSNSHPVFHQIHFNNDFEYLLLMWHPSYDEIYFAILTKEEARNIATLENTNREYEDNWEIHTTEFFDDGNKEFLKKIAKFLELNEELEDLAEERKLELVNASEEEIMKNPNAVKRDFSGETYQQWIYNYLSSYVDDAELMPREYKYDIKYKGKEIEIKYSALHDDETFKFYHIKPENFDFILFIGFDNKEKKFYFEIENREEYIENKKENVGSDDASSQNGNQLHVTKSFFTYGNDFTFEDFDNYIESH